MLVKMIHRSQLMRNVLHVAEKLTSQVWTRFEIFPLVKDIKKRRCVSVKSVVLFMCYSNYGTGSSM